MTDITELAQSLKRRATSAKEFGESLYVKADDVLALVEALEKAKGMEAYWKTQCRGITDHCEELQARIAELESRTVKLPPKVDSSNIPFAGHTWNCCLDEVEKRLAAAGIKVEAE